MGKKIRVGILFGGKSAEHEISILSAKSVIQAMDLGKYEVTPICIDKKGKWQIFSIEQFLTYAETKKQIPDLQKILQLIPRSASKDHFQKLDVIFPILHGPLGEDGTVQGLLTLAEIPFVGSGVLGSAIGMDKDVMKRLLRDAGISTAKFLSYTSDMVINFDEAVSMLGLPFFVKPANMGSSIAVNKVKRREEFKKAIEEAFQYDFKILIEEYVDGREIECSVLGNEKPIASLPCELILQHEFYTYKAKYLDENGSMFILPANIDSECISQIQKTAIKAYKVCCCDGMARVDFFLKKDGTLIFNELNTIPGFTRISMYAKMWEVSGIDYSTLIDKLIKFGLEKAQKRNKLHTTFSIPYIT